MIKISVIIILLALSTTSFGCSKDKETKTTSKMTEKTQDTINVSGIKVKTMDGSEKPLSDYKGKVLLIVNVASKCGYTKQYDGLQKIYEQYKGKGFEILAFHCNDFGGQEPGTNEEIESFCKTNYNVSFPLFDKIKVLVGEKSALYANLINFEPAGDISWNFEKFLVDKNGNVVGRYKSKVKPEELAGDVERLL